jgi:hypothetical protein
LCVFGQFASLPFEDPCLELVEKRIRKARGLVHPEARVREPCQFNPSIDLTILASYFNPRWPDSFAAGLAGCGGD